MNRHERRKLARTMPDRSSQVLAGLEVAARLDGYPSVDAMTRAKLRAAQGIVRRLSDDASLSIGDCQLLATLSLCLVRGPAGFFASQFILALRGFVLRPNQPTPDEAAKILGLASEFLRVGEMLGLWSLEGVGPLRLNDGPHTFDARAAALAPEEAVPLPKERACAICGLPFAEGDWIYARPDPVRAKAPWTSVEVHARCDEAETSAALSKNMN